jgi:anti-sigma regulatory factor (Ser/Thr protein kinase)
VNRVRVFVASPGDTEEERNRLETVVAELNRGIAAEHDLTLELVRWETHTRPGMGSDAQAVINRQLPAVDVVIAVFWKRLGTPTPRADSGTAEELQAAIEQWQAEGKIEILTYFNQSPYTPRQEELDQVERLFSFRKALESRGLFAWDYDGVPDFEAQVRQHLTAAIRAWKAGPKMPIAAEPAERDTAEQKIPFPDQVNVEIDVARPSDVHTFVANLRAILISKGFGGATADRTATVILELLANVRDHAPATSAEVRIAISTGKVFCTDVTVIQRGSSFDLSEALRTGRRAYQLGDREHGLVKIARLASHLKLDDAETAEGQVGLACSVYDLAPISSGVLGEFDFVAPASLEFDLPRRWVLGRDVHVARDLDAALEFAIAEPAPRLLDLYFSELQIPSNGYLGIEFAGRILPSEVGPISIDGEVPSTFPTPRSHKVIEAAFEIRFRPLFESQRVVMHAFETGYLPTLELEEWAALWNLPCFTDPDDLRAFLQERQTS